MYIRLLKSKALDWPIVIDSIDFPTIKVYVLYDLDYRRALKLYANLINEEQKPAFDRGVLNPSERHSGLIDNIS